MPFPEQNKSPINHHCLRTSDTAQRGHPAIAVESPFISPPLSHSHTLSLIHTPSLYPSPFHFVTFFFFPLTKSLSFSTLSLSHLLFYSLLFLSPNSLSLSHIPLALLFPHSLSEEDRLPHYCSLLCYN